MKNKNILIDLDKLYQSLAENVLSVFTDTENSQNPSLLKIDKKI